jgi:hypothetical protein
LLRRPLSLSLTCHRAHTHSCYVLALAWSLFPATLQLSLHKGMVRVFSVTLHGSTFSQRPITPLFWPHVCRGRTLCVRVWPRVDVCTCVSVCVHAYVCMLVRTHKLLHACMHDIRTRQGILMGSSLRGRGQTIEGQRQYVPVGSAIYSYVCGCVCVCVCVCLCVCTTYIHTYIHIYLSIYLSI